MLRKKVRSHAHTTRRSQPITHPQFPFLFASLDSGIISQNMGAGPAQSGTIVNLVKHRPTHWLAGPHGTVACARGINTFAGADAFTQVRGTTAELITGGSDRGCVFWSFRRRIGPGFYASSKMHDGNDGDADGSGEREDTQTGDTRTTAATKQGRLEAK